MLPQEFAHPFEGRLQRRTPFPFRDELGVRGELGQLLRDRIRMRLVIPRQDQHRRLARADDVTREAVEVVVQPLQHRIGGFGVTGQLVAPAGKPVADRARSVGADRLLHDGGRDTRRLRLDEA